MIDAIPPLTGAGRTSTFRATAVAGALLVTAFAHAPLTRADAGTGSVRLDLVDQMGGATMAVAVQGRHAYLGVGTRLEVLDISQPDRPVRVGRSPILPNIVRDVAIAGDYAFVAVAGAPGMGRWPARRPAPSRPGPDEVADGGDGLLVLDVSDPSTPRRVAALAMEARRVVLGKGRAYVAGRYTGVQMVDVADPMQPQRIGTLRADDLDAMDLAIAGDWLLASGGGPITGERCDQAGRVSPSGVLVAWDVSDPSSPRKLGHFDEAGGALAATTRHIFVTGPEYPSGGDDYLFILDAADLTLWAPIGKVRVPDMPTRLAVVDDRAYLVGLDGTLSVLDVTDPTAPRILGAVSIGGASALTAAGDTLYVASRSSGLDVVDVASPATPRRVGAYKPLALVDRLVAVRGRVVAREGIGIAVVDPASAPEMVRYRPPVASFAPQFEELVATSHTALVGLAAGGLARVDVPVDGPPAFSRLLANVSSIAGLAVSGENVYLHRLPDNGRTFQPKLMTAVIDQDGTAHILAESDLPQRMSKLAAGGGFLFGLVDPPSQAPSGPRISLGVVDMRDAAQPRLVTVFPLPNDVGLGGLSIELVNHHLLVSGYELGIVDVADPAQPRLVATVPRPAIRTHVRDGRALAATGPGVDVYDVGDPALPRLSGTTEVPGWTCEADAAGDLVFVAAGEAGLLTYLARPTVPVSRAYLPWVASTHKVRSGGVLQRGALAEHAANRGVATARDYTIPTTGQLAADVSGVDVDTGVVVHCCLALNVAFLDDDFGGVGNGELVAKVADDHP
jgi:hypothetical protein